MGIIVQVLGSLLILIGFVFSQFGKQWGFVLLEGVWSIVAIQGIFKYFNKKEVK